MSKTPKDALGSHHALDAADAWTACNPRGEVVATLTQEHLQALRDWARTRAALVDSEKFFWNGAGPTPEEVGARTLRFWCSKTEEWLPATWESVLGHEAWVNPTGGYARTTATYWRRPPNVPAGTAETQDGDVPL